MTPPYWYWYDQPNGYPSMTLPTTSLQITVPNSDSGNFDCIQYTRISDGNAVQLLTAAGATGRLAPAMEVYEDITPYVPGSQPRGTRFTARTVQLPVFVKPPINTLSRSWMRTIMSTVNPALGQGFLGSVSGLSDDRFLFAIYSGGVDQTQEPSAVNLQPTMNFYAFDPFWYEWDATDGGNLGPLNTSDGAGSNKYQVSFSNTGDAVAWPILSIIGDHTNTSDFAVHILDPTGTTIEQSMDFNAPIPPPDGGGNISLFIDTRPGKKQATLMHDDGSPPLSGSADFAASMIPGTGDLHLDPNRNYIIRLKNGGGNWTPGRGWIWCRRGWICV